MNILWPKNTGMLVSTSLCLDKVHDVDGLILQEVLDGGAPLPPLQEVVVMAASPVRGQVGVVGGRGVGHRPSDEEQLLTTAGWSAVAILSNFASHF